MQHTMVLYLHLLEKRNCLQSNILGSVSLLYVVLLELASSPVNKMDIFLNVMILQLIQKMIASKP